MKPRPPGKATRKPCLLRTSLPAASFVENFPEIAGLPVEQWEGALAAMAQREPGRFNKAMGTIQRVIQLQAAQEEQQQMRTRAEQQQFEAFTKSESERFNEMIKSEPKTGRDRG
jgi:hypothetical protein